MMVVPEGGSLFRQNLTQVVDGHTGVEHSIPLGAIYDDVDAALGRHEGRLHADARRRLRRHHGRALLVRPHRRLGRTSGSPASCRGACSMRARAAGRSRRRTSTTTSSSAKVAKQLLDAGVKVQLGAHGQREGLGGALGAVDDGAGRHDAVRGAARGDDRRRPLSRPRPRPRARSSRASSPTSIVLDANPRRSAFADRYRVAQAARRRRRR